MDWKLIQATKKMPKISKPILIEGLPGIGNVGKVVVDFMADNLGAVKIYDLFSFSFPNSVFVNEQNLVEMPKLEMYYKKIGKQEFIFIAGDIQPIDEQSCYSFCDTVLEFVHKHGGTEIITIGGIGLNKVPKTPKIFITGTSKKVIESYAKDLEAEKKIFGVVGPIMGVSGVMAGLAGRRGMNAAVILAETYGHPLYLGISGAREILTKLNKKFKMGLKLEKLDKEITSLEEEIIKKTTELESITKSTAIKRLKGKIEKELNYIG